MSQQDQNKNIVHFHRQSKLAIAMGVFFAVFGAPATAWLVGAQIAEVYSYGGFLYGFIAGIVVYVIYILFSVALIKLGAKWVPDYDELFKAIGNIRSLK